MAKSPPKLISLDHDDHAAEHVGHTKDGNQFFLTTPFVPAVGTNPGREFIALYVFDKAGALQSATIDDLGPRSMMDHGERVARRDELLASVRSTAQSVPVRCFGLAAYDPGGDREVPATTVAPRAHSFADRCRDDEF